MMSQGHLCFFLRSMVSLFAIEVKTPFRKIRGFEPPGAAAFTPDHWTTESNRLPTFFLLRNDANEYSTEHE
jgi:hypothetical protein